MLDVANLRIAVVDDRGSVVDEFEELFGIEMPGLAVEKFEAADDALAAIESGGTWSYWIVDLMMPTGEELGVAETEDGLSTGIALIKRLMSSETMVTGGIVAFTLRDVSQEDFGSENAVVIMSKNENTPTDVVDHIRRALNGTVANG